MSLKILVLNGWIGYPPFQKRIRSFLARSWSVQALGFNRDLQFGDSPVMQCASLGCFNKGRYLSRLKPLAAAILRLRREARNVDLVYALGFEMGALAVIACLGLADRPRISYEIHDIRDAVLGSSLMCRLLRWVETWFVRRLDLLVVTSATYLENYYFPILGINDVPSMVVENKLLPDELPPRRGITVKDHCGGDPPKFVIGYFGSLRCRASWSVLKRIVDEADGRIQVLARGRPLGLDSFAEGVERTREIEYRGPYAESELPEMYGEVDLVWATGFHEKISRTWGRLCRFYYACYFKIPPIVCKGSGDEVAVVKYDIGLAVDLEYPDLAIEQILGIDSNMLTNWNRNLDSLPDEVCCYTDENDRIAATLGLTAYEPT